MGSKPVSMMTLDEQRAFYRERYHKNDYKLQVQRERIITGLKNGTRRPKLSTLQKYGIEVDSNNNIIIPEKPKVVFTREDSANETNVIKVVVRKTESKIKPFNDANAMIDGVSIKNWIATVLVALPKTEGSTAVRSTKTIEAYMKVPNDLFKIYQVDPYDEKKDLTEWLTNEKALVSAIENYSRWRSLSSKAMFLGKILLLSKLYPPLAKKFSEQLYTSLNATAERWSGIATLQQQTVSKSTFYFIWDEIKNAVARKFTGESFEFLLVLIMDEIITRDDLGCLMAFSKNEIVDPDANYLLLDRKANKSWIYFNKYKTKDKYGRQIIQLSSRVTALIKILHPVGSKLKTLFPYDNVKLRKFMNDTFKQIPFLKNEPKLGIRYARHSLISTKIMKLDKNAPDYNEKLVDIAQKSFHSINMQSGYVSPLKDKNGNPLFSAEDIKKVNSVIVTRSKGKVG